MYQGALEGALAYQRELEETMEAQRQRIARLERYKRLQDEALWNQQLAMCNMVLRSYAEELEKTIKEQRARIEHLEVTIAIQQKLLRRQREP